MNLSVNEAFEYILKGLEGDWGTDIMEEEIGISIDGDLYDVIYEMYIDQIDTINPEMENIRQVLINGKSPDEPILKEFFRLIRRLINSIVNNTRVNPPNLIRGDVIRQFLNLNKDVTSTVIKYDYYFNGFCETALTVYEENKNSIQVFAISPNQFMTSIRSQPSSIWNTITKQQTVLTLDISQETMVLNTITIGNKIIASYNRDIKIWDNEVKTLSGHTDMITSIIKLPHGLIASSSYDGTVRIWDLENQIAVLRGDGIAINKIILLGNNYIVSGSFNGTIQMWNLETQKLEFDNKDGLHSAVSIEKLDESKIAALYTNGILKIYNLFTGTLESEMYILNDTEHIDDTVEYLYVNNGKAIVVTTRNIKIYNPKTQTVEFTLYNEESTVSSCINLPDNKLIVGYEDGKLRIWDLETGILVQTLFNGPFEISHITILPKSYKIIVGTLNSIIKIWE